MDTPFQWTKQIASHFGGTRNGLVISWPARIKDKGGIRTQFSSVIDIYPTILEAVGVQSPSMLNGVGVDRTTIAAKDALNPGKHTIIVDFKYDGGGIGKGGVAIMTVDGAEVANGKLTRTIPFRVSADETLDIGEDTGTPVSEDYHVPFKCSGTLDKFVVDLGEAGLSPQDQKELDQQEGSNEVVD
jgi:arylsulfatase A-like enzyme